MKRIAKLALILVSLALTFSALPSKAQVPYVIVISVDGLGGTYLNTLFNRTDNIFPIPNFRRLRSEGASTLAAHIDNNNWETLPNHTSIITARPRDSRDGLDGHGWTLNTDPTNTIHMNKKAYVASVFDVAHDNGFTTGLYANKTKFSLFDTYSTYTGGGSYNSVNGAPDITGVDNGHDKVDNTYLNATLGGIVVDTFIAKQKTASPNHYAFIHINEPDSFGHKNGWGSLTWCTNVVVVDTMIGKILKLVERDVPAMKGNTIIILTADHGNQDNPPTPADRYSVPFFVWGPGVPAGGDLYVLNMGNRRRATSYPMSTYAGVQPIRNAEANNLALQMLGLGPITGSAFNYAQDLRVFAPTPAITSMTRSQQGEFTITGTADRSGNVVLLKSGNPTLQNWIPIQTNAVIAGSSFGFTVPAGAESMGFFRMLGQ